MSVSVQSNCSAAAKVGLRVSASLAMHRNSSHSREGKSHEQHHLHRRPGRCRAFRLVLFRPALRHRQAGRSSQQEHGQEIQQLEPWSQNDSGRADARRDGLPVDGPEVTTPPAASRS